MFKSFFSLLIRCYRLALPYGRFKLFAVMSLILFNGILQLIGVTSIFPFFALAADPDRIRNSKFGSWLLSFLPAMDANHLLAAAGIFAILMLVFASIGSMLSEVLRIRYAYGFSQWLRGRLMRSYASKPYGFFLQINSSELNRKIFDIQQFTSSILLPVGEIITRIVLIALLVGMVFFVQPVIAIGAVVLLGGFYLAAFLWMRPRTRIAGNMIQLNQAGFWKNTNQFLQGIKTVMVHSKSSYFIEQALKYSDKVGFYQSQIPIYSNGPRYLIDPIAFGGLVSIVVIMALQGRPFSDILPNLMVMAMAGYRLLPSLQLLFGQLVTVASNQYTLTQLEDEIGQIEFETNNELSDQIQIDTIEFSREITLDKISFQYPGSDIPIIKDFSLRILKNQSIGIAGPSGSGKSTIVDLMLGLHISEKGSILVDGKGINYNNVNTWRALIGYVPQEIYLLDESIAENIAFGIPRESIDQSALKAAAEGAQILTFIEGLPDGFETLVGERGVRLSGGQRQRIGLARALYHKPQILILDEATSALDHATEAAVMETIHRLQGKLTIITIAHRLSTLERCNKVISLDLKK
jgi:ATP-binding cassette subfamily C protein